MAEGAGGNTGPFDITILTLLENEERNSNKCFRTDRGDCQPDARFSQRGARGGEGHLAGLARPGADEAAADAAKGRQRPPSSKAPALECQTHGVASNS
jgi:hypothetical protein